MKKIFYLFAGINGAGKSTLYNNSDNEEIKKSVRINTDEIVREFGDWKNNLDQLKAAKIAIKLRNESFEKGKSINEETTLTGKTILKTIDKAKELGYELQLFYVGLNSPEIAKERIKIRVSKGGHNIEDKIVDRRYYESLENLEKVINKFDKVRIYDNSIGFLEIFSFSNGKVNFKTNEKTWADKAIGVKKLDFEKETSEEEKEEKR
jgi:hypothetical protein